MKNKGLVECINPEENQKKNVTLYLNSVLYNKYVGYCKKEGFVMIIRTIDLYIYILIYTYYDI